MLQQVMLSPGEIVFREVEKPVIKADELLIRVMKLGICGSDVHVYHGTHPFTSYPVTQGHEVSGEVVEVGAETSGFHVGQKVTIQPQITCGRCYLCRHGRYNLCENLKVMGFQTTGTASQYFAVPARLAVPLPDEMSFDCGAMIEPLAVAVHAVRKAGDPTGKNMVVIGLGPIGNLVFQVAKALGANRVLAVGRGGVRGEIAKKSGADVVIDSRTEDLEAAILDTFGPDKADVIFDCAGNDASIGDAIRCARKGSQILLVAVFGKLANVDLAVLNDHELELNTSMMYREEDYKTAVELVASGKVSLEPLMSKFFPFREYSAAYQYIDSHRSETMKVIINVQE